MYICSTQIVCSRRKLSAHSTGEMALETAGQIHNRPLRRLIVIIHPVAGFVRSIDCLVCHHVTMA
jgi:hypothetical protein